MSLTTKNHLSLVLQTIKKLLSFKADKSELATKIDRSEVEEEDAISVALTTDLIPSGIPLSEDGSIYTDENGVIYIL
jgi:deoxyhypusine synthase